MFQFRVLGDGVASVGLFLSKVMTVWLTNLWERQKKVPIEERSTGKLHLGHCVGTIQNRVTLHKEYECFFIIADLYMLTIKNTKQDIQTTAENARCLV